MEPTERMKEIHAEINTDEVSLENEAWSILCGTNVRLEFLRCGKHL